jgi:uncharacterized membrane protein
MINMNNFHETKTRSVIKSILWRVIATLLTWAVAYYFTGTISGSLKITLTAAAISMIAYYFHERIWDRIDWGKTQE